MNPLAVFAFLPTPKPGAADKVRARRAKLSGKQLESHDRACAAWAEHLEAEIAEEDELLGT